MTTITLEIPDDMAARLTPLREQLPQLLSSALELWPSGLPLAITQPSSTHSVFDELINLLASRPTLEQIVAFKISPSAQDRLAALLDKNREEGLSEAESTELDWYEYLHHIILRLKAQARLEAAK